MIFTLAHGGHEHAAPLAASAPAIAGLIAGAAHVATGPDHLAAVAPLALEQRRRLWLAGCLWGAGHSGSVWLLAVLVLLFRESLPIEAMSGWGEVLVGVVLIGVGVWGLHRVLRLHVHTHRHTHADPTGRAHTHEHTHIHATSTHKDDHAEHGHEHTHSLLGIGALHGLAGTAHVLGVIPALAMPTRADAFWYLASFGVGSIIGMGVFTLGLGILARATDTRNGVGSRAMMMGCSLMSVAIGVYWLVPGAG